jgi:hypothetical protein
MAIIVKPNTLTNGTVAQATDVEADLTTIYNDYNGNITNANIAANAAIADSKLAQITTAAKVSGAALTSFANISASAGTIPIVNIPILHKVVTTTYSIATTGVQTITGAGFTPRGYRVITLINGAPQYSDGVCDNAGATLSIASQYARTAGNYTSNANNGVVVDLFFSGSDETYATHTSLDSDGCTLTWAKAGTGTGTAVLLFDFFR